MDKKTKINKDDPAFKAKLDRWWSQASNSRKNIDWRWFSYDLWVSGNHYAKWDRSTQQIVTSAKPDGKPKIVINKVYTTLRAVRNYTLRNRPKAEVTPYNLTAENIDEAVKINQFLDYMHDKLSLRTKLRASMWHALKYSVGYWQILWDEDADDEMGEIECNIVDPYDLYFDPAAKDVGDARYLILAVRRNLADLQEDSKYKGVDWDLIKPDNQLSSSTMKTRVLQYEKGGASQTTSNEKGEGTVILKEYWYKEGDKIYICAKVGDQIVRKPEDTGLDRFPFFKLASDINPLALYGEGWAKNIIPVNRLLNMLESSLAEYNNILNKGKWISDKGAGVRIINNENGQIIEKKRGFDVHQGQIAPLSGAIYTQIEAANRYIEDIGALHDASLGRIPTGANSGKAIEALQVGDSNNLSELVENCEEFLENVYEYILYLASQKYQFARNITATRNTGVKDFLVVIGENAANQPEGATVIAGKNMVDVKITSWLANTAEARREVLKELYQMQIVDKETVLEGYAIGNVANVIQKVRKEQEQAMQDQVGMEQQQMDMQSQAQGQQMQAQQEQVASTLPGKQQAIAMIRLILQGQVPQVPEAVGQDFVDYFSMFLQTPEAQQLDAPIIQVLERTRDQAIQAAGAAPIPTNTQGMGQ